MVVPWGLWDWPDPVIWLPLSGHQNLAISPQDIYSPSHPLACFLSIHTSVLSLNHRLWRRNQAVPLTDCTRTLPGPLALLVSGKSKTVPCILVYRARKPRGLRKRKGQGWSWLRSQAVLSSRLLQGESAGRCPSLAPDMTGTQQMLSKCLAALGSDGAWSLGLPCSL